MAARRSARTAKPARSYAERRLGARLSATISESGRTEKTGTSLSTAWTAARTAPARLHDDDREADRILERGDIRLDARLLVDTVVLDVGHDAHHAQGRRQ